jgi:hypothetical protein
MKDFNKLMEDRENSPWVPACGGTEQPFTVKGYRLLYMWQPASGRHAYIDLDKDIFLTQGEVEAIFMRK